MNIMTKRRVLVGVFLMIGAVTGSCGYRVASKNRVVPQVKKIAVVPLENRTTTFEIEQLLTRALVKELVSATSHEVVNDPSQAEAVFEGEVSRISVSPVTFGRSSFGSTFLVTLHAGIRLRNRATDAILFENNGYVFREQYVINVDVSNFFSELNPALDRIAADFASSVVATIRDGF